MADSLMGPATGLVNSKLALADAGTENVLSGKKFYAGDKIIKTGSMPNNGAWKATINPGQAIQVPYGYHNGSGRITANAITSNDMIGRLRSDNTRIGVNVGSDRYIVGIISADLHRYSGDSTVENGEWAYLGISGDHHSITGYGNGAGAIGYTYIQL